ncbi:hypothetical protein D3C78_1451810 [compost metagenome]
MIMSDISNDRNNRLYDVGYIKTPAKSRLPYDIVRERNLGIEEDGQRCRHLEHRRRAQLRLCDSLDMGLQHISQLKERLLIDIDTIILKPVRKFCNIRRSKCSHIIPAAQQDTRQKCAGRAFAVRSCYMDKL